MHDDLRRQYLSALGIPVWERRQRPPGPVPAASLGGEPDVGRAAAPEAAVAEQAAPPPGHRSQPAPVSVTPKVGPAVPAPASPGVVAAAPPISTPPAAPPTRSPASAAPASGAPAPAATALPATPAVSEPTAGGSAVAALGWDDLAATVAACTGCRLHAGRTQTVFGVGNRQAHWMFVGEAPGADEDRQGEPFVGRAGQLLNAMLFALGLKREQVFIANVLKCRPPDNRDPQDDEVAACEPYLQRQIALIQPRLIVALGRHAAHSLLRTEVSLAKLRGQRLSYQGIPLVVTYHPAYLLRTPSDKRKAWEDLKRARAIVEQGA